MKLNLPDKFRPRLAMTSAGVILCAIAVGFFKCSLFVLMLIIAVVVMCFAASLYMTSDLGVSVYDAIPIIISNKSKKPFRFCRIGCDLVCVIIGALCGLLPGLGTLITAFFIMIPYKTFDKKSCNLSHFG